MKYRAKFQSADRRILTRWYPTEHSAQYQLMMRVCWFPLLGTVHGDVFENGECTIAHRNGGTVSLEKKEA